MHTLIAVYRRSVKKSTLFDKLPVWKNVSFILDSVVNMWYFVDMRGGDGVLAKERQIQILALLKKNGAVITSDLVKVFRVSVETIRRDLLQLEQQGRLNRVHGGAVTKTDMKPFSELPKRNLENSSLKTELSKRAVEFVAEGDVIGVDSGSTAIFFADVLKERFECLTVVTHSIDVFKRLYNHKNFTVILCGGYYKKSENAFYGSLTLAMLESVHVQKVFIFPSAVSIEHGIFDYQSELLQVQKQLIRSADDVYILADSSKFEKKALLKMSDTKKSYIYITDASLPEEIVSLYKENEITICKGEYGT